MQALFRTMWEVEQTWMPEVRVLCASAEPRELLLTVQSDTVVLFEQGHNDSRDGNRIPERQVVYHA